MQSLPIFLFIAVAVAPILREGGVHTQLLSRLPTSGTSVRHLNACFADFVLVHNLRVSPFSNSTACNS